MSDPIRYTVLDREKSKHLETPLVAKEDGGLVRWEDYARLKAEVERLRKAGDALAEECENFQGTWKLLDAWNAAKEGNPSV